MMFPRLSQYFIGLLVLLNPASFSYANSGQDDVLPTLSGPITFTQWGTVAKQSSYPELFPNVYNDYEVGKEICLYRQTVDQIGIFSSLYFHSISWDDARKGITKSVACKFIKSICPAFDGAGNCIGTPVWVVKETSPQAIIKRAMCPQGYKVITNASYQLECIRDSTAIDLVKNNAEFPSCNHTNPIDEGTGNKYQLETDYVSRGAGNLEFKRYYNSNTTRLYQSPVSKDLLPTPPAAGCQRRSKTALKLPA